MLITLTQRLIVLLPFSGMTTNINSYFLCFRVRGDSEKLSDAFFFHLQMSFGRRAASLLIIWRHFSFATRAQKRNAETERGESELAIPSSRRLHHAGQIAEWFSSRFIHVLQDWSRLRCEGKNGKARASTRRRRKINRLFPRTCTPCESDRKSLNLCRGLKRGKKNFSSTFRELKGARRRLWLRRTQKMCLRGKRIH